MGAMRALFVCGVFLVGCGLSDDGPRIDRMAPPLASPGTVIDVLGVSFCSVEGGCDPERTFVTFGSAPGLAPADLDEERLQVEVPNVVPGPTSVVVTVDGVESNPGRWSRPNATRSASRAGCAAR